jgi:peroxiredoxin
VDRPWRRCDLPLRRRYLAAQDALKAKGIEKVYVYCVNDGAVMTAWAKDQKIEVGAHRVSPPLLCIVSRGTECNLNC